MDNQQQQSLTIATTISLLIGGWLAEPCSSDYTVVVAVPVAATVIATVCRTQMTQILCMKKSSKGDYCCVYCSDRLVLVYSCLQLHTANCHCRPLLPVFAKKNTPFLFVLVINSSYFCNCWLM